MDILTICTSSMMFYSVISRLNLIEKTLIFYNYEQT